MSNSKRDPRKVEITTVGFIDLEIGEVTIHKNKGLRASRRTIVNKMKEKEFLSDVERLKQKFGSR